ncbi:MAG: NAD(P)/FAD-dependent oxidoreductase [Gemmatimonadetes bacterium]|nr:NAD(P)/FAD-dependent oxidoreductase [Gemmatimonadota bacterium]
MPHVVVLGGGFAGLTVCRELRNEPVRITLIDRRNHHLFQPLLYQVATAGLAAPDIAAPLRNILRNQPNVSVLMAEADAIDRDARSVHLKDGTALTYDWLVVATGATHAYFGNDDWARHARGLKTLEDAIAIRRQMLLAYENAEKAQTAEERVKLLTFVVIGGGPTGVELAGALAEIASKTMARNFRNFDPRDARVILLEREAHVLNSYPDKLPERARRQLEKLGVQVRTGTTVTQVDADGVTTDAGRIDAATVLWAAGVAASPIGRALGAPVDRAGRVCVTDTLNVPDDPRVFVVGDLAVLKTETPIPPTAPAAIQMGEYAARCIRRAARGREAPGPFRFKDKGEMATIGRSKAVARIGRLRVHGVPAWLMWLLVHVIFLIGFRNRLVVFMDWAWSYLTFQRSARVILDPDPTDAPSVADASSAVVPSGLPSKNLEAPPPSG